MINSTIMSSRAALAALAASAILVSNVAVAEETCPCPTDTKIRIGGVSHGNTADSFWDPIYSAAAQAALDSNVELDFARYESSSMSQQGGQDIITWMVERIEMSCNAGDNAVDGFFSTINHPDVLAALQSNCLANKIPTNLVLKMLPLLGGSFIMLEHLIILPAKKVEKDY